MVGGVSFLTTARIFAVYTTLSFLVPMEENLGVRIASNQDIKCARSSSSVYSVQAAVGC